MCIVWDPVSLAIATAAQLALDVVADVEKD